MWSNWTEFPSDTTINQLPFSYDKALWAECNNQTQEVAIYLASIAAFMRARQFNSNVSDWMAWLKQSGHPSNHEPGFCLALWPFFSLTRWIHEIKDSKGFRKHSIWHDWKNQCVCMCMCVRGGNNKWKQPTNPCITRKKKKKKKTRQKQKNVEFTCLENLFILHFLMAVANRCSHSELAEPRNGMRV